MEIEKKYYFILNEQEAILLKAFVQNPLFADETAEEEKLREKIFKRLSDTSEEFENFQHTDDDDDIPF